MAGKQDISTALKRQLRSGKEYEKLMPAVKCESTPLGEGDTFFTVDQMRAWVEKYRWQTAKLALVLEGQSLQGTIANIYQFLYDHVQYTADGALQQLRSPACTWLQRKTGTDCKSFSVFASSILSNLGIKHAIRQVRQPYFFPDEFTHVYVVVYQDQTKETYSENAPTFVIDATRHQNTEVEYLEKADIFMPKLMHVGLNAPQDERTQRIIENFDSFCHFLLKKGAPEDQVIDLRKAVNYYTSKGFDPRINLVYDGVQVEGIVYPVSLTEYVPYLAIKQAFNSNRVVGLTGLGFSFSDAFSSFSGSTASNSTAVRTTSSSSGSGNANGGIVDAGLDLAAGAIPFGGIIKGILDKLELSKNISNVLKYGLSSWGASLTPEEIKKRFAENCYPWLQKMLSETTMENVDRQLTAIDANLRGNNHLFRTSQHEKAKSTKLANDWAEAETEKLLKEVIDGFNAQFEANNIRVTKRAVKATSSELRNYPIQGFSSGKDLKKAAPDRLNEIDFYVYTVDKSSLKSWNNQQLLQQQNQNNNTPTTTPTTGNTYQPVNSNGGATAGNGNGNGPVVTGQGETKSGNGGIIAAGVGLALLPFLLPMLKGGAKTVSKPAKKAK
ncbi:hypothetical protein RM553_12725 [Zunongwangia sp. F363]|uniref:Uncharacterized protein n=1 Tax=Autumnicola tepida TaxID=3075595 RepID=A0ABU3CBI6_9FLAO|nr:hypothetical protein [Zunongwangia sp. F363]MDT0643699.1 hypothetical protein [Zunongwangia sp. F363]